MDKARMSIYLSELHRTRAKVLSATKGLTQGELVEHLIDAEYQKYLESVAKAGDKQHGELTINRQ